MKINSVFDIENEKTDDCVSVVVSSPDRHLHSARLDNSGNQTERDLEGLCQWCVWPVGVAGEAALEFDWTLASQDFKLQQLFLLKLSKQTTGGELVR